MLPQEWCLPSMESLMFDIDIDIADIGQLRHEFMDMMNNGGANIEIDWHLFEKPNAFVDLLVLVEYFQENKIQDGTYNRN